MRTYRIVDESSTSRSSGETEESSQSTETTLVLTFLGSLSSLSGFDTRSKGNGESGEKDESREFLELSVFSLVSGEGDPGGVKSVEFAVGGGVEEEVLTDGEDLGHFVVEGCHHLSLGGTLRHAEKGVDILGSSEGFLPKFELDSGVELLETGIEVTLECIGVVEVDRVSLVSVLLGRGKVRSEGFGESTEFGFALVGEAELESVLRNGLRDDAQRISIWLDDKRRYRLTW